MKWSQMIYRTHLFLWKCPFFGNMQTLLVLNLIPMGIPKRIILTKIAGTFLEYWHKLKDTVSQLMILLSDAVCYIHPDYLAITTCDWLLLMNSCMIHSPERLPSSCLKYNIYIWKQIFRSIINNTLNENECLNFMYH